MTPSKIFNATPQEFLHTSDRCYARLFTGQLVRWSIQRNHMVPRDRRELRKFRTERARAVKLHLQTQPHPQPSFV